MAVSFGWVQEVWSHQRKYINRDGLWGFEASHKFTGLWPLLACTSQCDLLAVSPAMPALCSHDAVSRWTPTSLPPYPNKPFLLQVAVAMGFYYSHRKVISTANLRTKKRVCHPSGLDFWTNKTHLTAAKARHFREMASYTEMKGVHVVPVHMVDGIQKAGFQHTRKASMGLDFMPYIRATPEVCQN